MLIECPLVENQEVEDQRDLIDTVRGQTFYIKCHQRSVVDVEVHVDEHLRYRRQE